MTNTGNDSTNPPPVRIDGETPLLGTHPTALVSGVIAKMAFLDGRDVVYISLLEKVSERWHPYSLDLDQARHLRDQLNDELLSLEKSE